MVRIFSFIGVWIFGCFCVESLIPDVGFPWIMLAGYAVGTAGDVLGRALEGEYD